ncbi:MAG: DUF2786 domain-containing protein [Deltaproteobacteria bacterium]|jgi:hypothetical protein|nr:DUF2786 domain-containing protein [Deltaproteobacteria bacterium]
MFIHQNAEAKIKTIWTEMLLKVYFAYMTKIAAFRAKKISPAGIIIFNHSDFQWGYWDCRNRNIGISWKLIEESPWDVVEGVVGHETAHQLVSDLASSSYKTEPSHGATFQFICSQLHLDPIYQRAKIDYKESGLPPSIFEPQKSEDNPILEKVKKLLALTSSPEPHEAATALAMAGKLMARHNIEMMSLREASPELFERRRFCLKTVKFAPEDTYVAMILRDHFFVYTIFTYYYDALQNKTLSCLDILGRRVNLIMAEHVFYFLKERCLTLWEAHKPIAKAQGEQGLGAKNSFIRNLLLSFHEKLLKVAREDQTKDQKMTSALILSQDSALEQFKREKYPHLISRSTASTRVVAPNCALAGKEAGQALTIHAPIGPKQPGRNSGGLIDYKR